MTQNLFSIFDGSNTTPAVVVRKPEPDQTAENNAFKSWKFLGGKVIANTEKERFQIVFTEIPDKDIRNELKKNGFHWSPSNNAWQRLLNFNSLVALRRLPYLSKIAGSITLPEVRKTTAKKQETLKELLERTGCHKVNEHNYNLTLDGKPVAAFYKNDGVYSFNACKNGELAQKLMLAIMLDKKGE